MNSKNKGESLIIKALLKYDYQEFSLVILEYCSIENLDKCEQFWISLLEPEYNILKFVKTSLGYKHTETSLSKMKGLRPQFKPSVEQINRLIQFNQSRKFSQEDRDKLSKQSGFNVYVYDSLGSLITIYSSIVRFKKDYNIKWHHKTLYKRICQGFTINNHIFSLVPLEKVDNDETYKSKMIKGFKSITKYKNEKFYIKNIELKPKKIKLINIENSDLSKTFDSLNSATNYIKKMDGKIDKATIRKHLNSDKLYHKCWKICEVIE